MTQEYSNLKRASDPYALPDIEVFQLTAEEACELLDEDTIFEYRKRFPLAGFNSRDRQRMLDALIAEEGITGGWYWHVCFPGCMPDSDPMGPFDSYSEALADAQDGMEEE